MRSTLLVTVLACLAMFSLQGFSDERRLALTKDYHHLRRMGLKFPKQVCKPAHKVGVFVLDTAVMCAIEAIIPGAGTIAKAIKMGKKIADKLGVMGKINALKTKAEKFVVGKFLGVFGCKLRRRLGWFKKAFHHVVKKVGKTVKKVGKTVNKVGHDIGKTAKQAGKTINHVAKHVGKVANTIAKEAGKGVKFVSKNWAKIQKVICPVVKPLCKPACAAASSSFRAAGAAIAASFHIPIGCLATAVENGCHRLCKALCGRRRLAIRRL